MRNTRSKKDVAVALCDCGAALRERLDFERIEKQLAQDSAVVKVLLCSRFCDHAERSKTIKALAAAGAKRLAVAACNPEVFQAALSQDSNGFKDGLCWSVNIREQCAWVTTDKSAATDKAIELIKSAVRRLKKSEPVKPTKARLNRDIVVLGGTAAAMQTAVALAELGHRVTIVHKADKLGAPAGGRSEFFSHLADDCAQAALLVQRKLTELIEQVNHHKNIKVYPDASMAGLQGQFGNFSVSIKSDGPPRQLTAGALVLAFDSFCDFPFDSFGLGNPFTTVDMDKLHRLIQSGDVPGRVAIVTDMLGQQGPAVSAQALSAAELMARRFAVKVKLFCRNVQVAATGLENLYRRARQAGVVVVKTDSAPVISENGREVHLTYKDTLAGAEITEEFGLLVCADSVPAGNSKVASLIKQFRPGPAGAMQFDNIWLLPTDTNLKGVFAVGSARGDGEYRQALADGLAAASEIHNLLADKQIEICDDAAVVDADKCVLCLTCMRICPHGAISIDTENKAVSVSSLTCQRCGICASECPAQAIQLTRYTDDQTRAEVGHRPFVVVFACENSALPAATAAGLGGAEYDPKVRLIRVPCAGKVDPTDVLAALEAGAEKVKILGCHPESCRYLSGSTRAQRKVNRIAAMLQKCGFDKSRVSFGGLASVEPAKFIEYVNA